MVADDGPERGTEKRGSTCSTQNRHSHIEDISMSGRPVRINVQVPYPPLCPMPVVDELQYIFAPISIR